MDSRRIRLWKVQLRTRPISERAINTQTWSLNGSLNIYCNHWNIDGWLWCVFVSFDALSSNLFTLMLTRAGQPWGISTVESSFVIINKKFNLKSILNDFQASNAHSFRSLKVDNLYRQLRSQPVISQINCWLSSWFIATSVPTLLWL